MMNRGKQREEKTGPVKAAVSAYGNRILGRSNTTKSFQTYNYLELEKADSDQFTRSRKLAESVVAESDSKLFGARKMVKNLSLRIHESNLTGKTDTRELDKVLHMAKTREKECKSEKIQHANVVTELELIKQELRNLKQDLASILEEKKRAEGEINSSRLNMKSCSSLVAMLTKEIAEINEEHVLVELARVEAAKEYEEIEARSKEKSERFLAIRDKIQRKMKKMVRKIRSAKKSENTLVATLSDINMLENELKNVKKMDMNVRYQDSNSHETGKKRGSEPLLVSVTKELEAGNKELASIKEEGQQFMTSMDTVKNELIRVAEDISQLKKKEKTSKMIYKNLNSELLRAKAQLEAISTAEDPDSEATVSKLPLAIERLKSEAKTAKKERFLASEETAIIKEGSQQTENEIDLTEERLQTALQDLKAVKASEAETLENLQEKLEVTMRSRASASQPCSTISISSFEYDYLTGHASWAKEIAGKKVAAAHAWTEAIKASEKEIIIKTKLSMRGTMELKAKVELELSETELSVDARLQPETSVQREAKNRSFRLTNNKKGRYRRTSMSSR